MNLFRCEFYKFLHVNHIRHNAAYMTKCNYTTFPQNNKIQFHFRIKNLSLSMVLWR